MSLITSAATLNAAVAEWLARADLSTANVGIDLMIQQAEARLKRDPRVKTLGSVTLTADADDEAAPAGFYSLVSLEHNGPTYYGAIEIVSPSIMADLKGRYGTSGVPRYTCVIDNGGTVVFRFAPVPSGSYALRCLMWQTLTALSAGSNWLISSHPDIYLYATLCESAMYLQEDERLAQWEAALEQRIEALALMNWEHAYSGSPIRPQFSPIGG